MNFIEHIIEPQVLLLAWQNEQNRKRYIVAELTRVHDSINLIYLQDTRDFRQALELGFQPYPAFPDVCKKYSNVIDAFMRRIPPRSREDFTQYLEGLRLPPKVEISDFGLLGYSGAKLPSDNFSLIHPFEGVVNACELFIEVAGFQYYIDKNNNLLKIGDKVTFTDEFNSELQESAIVISANKQKIGYINRGLLPAFTSWLNDNRIIDACIEKLNGSPTRPTAYIFVRIAKQS